MEQSRFIARRQQQLVIREKILSLSGDSFSIKNQDGDIIFWVDGGVLSLCGRKHVRDNLGTQLFDIRKKLLTLRTAFLCEDSQGRTFEVKRQFSMCKSLITRLRAMYTNHGGSWFVQSNWDP